MMKCDQIQSRLDDYLDGELESSGLQAFEGHLGECAECRGTVAQSQRLQESLADLPVSGPSEGFADRALAAAAAARPVRSRSAQWIGAGFVAAFAASVLTVILTGLLVEAPRTEISAGLPTVSMTVDETRTINLVFASMSEIDDVSLLIHLPDGIEIAGYAGRREVVWNTQLKEGKNVLPLELIAHEEVRGQLVARLQHGDREKIFRVFVSVTPG